MWSFLESIFFNLADPLHSLLPLKGPIARGGPFSLQWPLGRRVPTRSGLRARLNTAVINKAQQSDVYQISAKQTIYDQNAYHGFSF